ncbi:head maturation protease, ClpP-related [Micromonospora carbonacea]|uniref:head maturation protease, ClpP-related n=1 Tax=Micromonospora carbonacea TaxID=47853 RepID=UPI0037178BE3
MKPRTARPLARADGSRRDWYRINNLASTGAAEVWIYDEIGWFGVSAQDFIRDVNAITADRLDVHISSPGGDVFDAVAIFQALRNHKASITTYVDSLAASSASFIALAGDKRVIAPHGMVMIHEAWGMCIGNAADMGKMVDELDRVSANIASIYATRAGGEVDEWRAAMRAETWYSPAEAVAAGLMHEVQQDTDKQPAEPARNGWDLSIFNYAGRDAAPPPRLPRPVAAVTETPTADELPAAEPEATNPEPKGDPVSDLSAIRSRLGLDDTADETAILAALDERLPSDEPNPDPDETTQEPAPEPNPVPSPTPQPNPAPAAPQTPAAPADNPFAAELARVSAELAEIRSREAANKKNAILDAAVKAGKIKPADRKSWETRYDKAPDVIADVLNSIADGTAVPTGVSGYTGSADTTVDLDAEWERQMAALDGPTATTGGN